jgi:hypothetical protein
MMPNWEADQHIDKLAFDSMLRVGACWLSTANGASFLAADDESLAVLYASVKIAGALFLVDQAMGREHRRIAYTH